MIIIYLKDFYGKYTNKIQFKINLCFWNKPLLLTKSTSKIVKTNVLKYYYSLNHYLF